jgi:hypothetical protein
MEVEKILVARGVADGANTKIRGRIGSQPTRVSRRSSSKRQFLATVRLKAERLMD